MDLVWLRPMRKPVRPKDIEDLSSPARRVLECLERRFMPRNPFCGAARRQEQPLPFFGIGSTAAAPPSQDIFNIFGTANQGGAVDWDEPPFGSGPPRPSVEDSPSRQPSPPSSRQDPLPRSVLAQEDSPLAQPSQQRLDMGVFVPRNILTNFERLSTEENFGGNTAGEPAEANGSQYGNFSPLDMSLEIRNLADNANSRPHVSNHDLLNDESMILSSRSPPISIYDDDVDKHMNSFSTNPPNNSPPFSSHDINDEDFLSTPPMNSPLISNYDIFDEDAMGSFHNDSVPYPEPALNVTETAEEDKENFRSSGRETFDNTADLLIHIDACMREQDAKNNDISLYGSPLKDITQSLNETNCSNAKNKENEKSVICVKKKPLKGCESPLFTQSFSSIQIKCVNSAPPVSPLMDNELNKTMLSDFSLDDIFETSDQCNISEEKNCQHPVTDMSPVMGKDQACNKPITPGSKNRKKFLGTSFQRALSSNRLTPKAISGEVSCPNEEESLPPAEVSNQKGAEKNSSTRGQKIDFCTLFQTPAPNNEKPPDTEEAPMLFPIFLGQSKRKTDNIDNSLSQPTSCKKRLKFTVPYKKKEQDAKPCSSHKDIQELSAKLSREMNSRKMKTQNPSETLAHDISERMKSEIPEEISMTLQYRGGFCQLNRPNTSGTLFPESILARIMWSADVKYISIPLQKCLWSSGLVKILFMGKTRKVCFEAQEMIQLIVDKFGFSASEVSSEWVVLDPLIGCWLLDPDNHPQSFQNVLTMMKMSEEMAGAESLLCKLSECAKILYEHLTKCGLWKLFLHIEMRVTPILACMELYGIQVDVKKLQDMGTFLGAQLDDVQKLAYKAAGRQFMLNSPQQLGNVLYDHLKLDVKHNISVKATEKKLNKSTSEATLIQFKDVHPLPGLVLEFRRMHKLKSTYVDAMIGHVSKGSIYTRWDQISAATGRITSSEPNLQTIPKQPLMPDKPDLLLRTGFVARNGYTFLAADFQHIELRVFAHLSKDAALIEALSQSTDVFKILSQQWLQIEDITRVTEEARDKTKRIMYALMYGAGASKLVEFLHIDISEANKILKKFSSTFPKMDNFSKSIVRDCRKQGYLTTETGRRRLFPNINSPNFQHRMHSERQAVNFLIQGTAADLCKCAMVQTQRYLTGIGSNKSVPGARLLLQIHDELLWEIPDTDVMDAADIVQKAMEEATSVFQSLSNFSVPLPVVMKIGKSWGELRIVKNVSLGLASQQP